MHEQENYAQGQIQKHMNSPVPEEEQGKYYDNPAEYWNKFYTASSEAGNKKVFEIGCGAGNTMYPLLEQSQNPELFVYAADYSSTAVQVVLNNPDYNPERSKAFVWDLASEKLPEDIEPESLDIIVMIFVFSALAPEQWGQAIKNLHRMLKPGGLVLFRDYGRYDLAQLRFKEKRLLKENFYIRGDGTRVYFFTPEELDQLFTTTDHPFKIEQNAVDRRLLVNRSRKLKMYRVWLQGKFRKL
ncbi:unnamed protein product [Cunninghamella echinulata]